MKLEKLGINKKKKIAIGVVVFLCFISVIIYTGSRAKYRVTESIPLVNGTINYKPYDFKMMAMYQANESGGYTEITKMTESGYTINEEKSYCKVNGEKDLNAKLYTNANGEHVIGNLQKNSKCYVWFDKLTTKKVDTVLGKIDVNIECSDTFSKTATTDEGICETEDDWGTSYYYRGAVDDNWVQFAGFYWRIIRINGDGSIRMIYNGPTTDQTGETTQIGTKAYNTKYNDNAYIGLMYGTVGSSTYAATHANTNNSTILGTTTDTTTLLGWYKANIADKGYSGKVSTEAGFCNDRKVYEESSYSGYTTLGYGTNATTYEPLARLGQWNESGSMSWKSSQEATLKCPQIANDLFTASGSTKGNKKLQYPVGLITSDEVVYAGGKGGSSNSSYYLYTNQYYWTMSPRYMGESGSAFVFYVTSSGSLFTGSNVNWTAPGVRPVINLASDVKLTGSGTTSDPYKIV